MIFYASEEVALTREKPRTNAVCRAPSYIRIKFDHPPPPSSIESEVCSSKPLNYTLHLSHFMSLSSRGLARAALISPGGPMAGLFQAIKTEWRPGFKEGISRLDVRQSSSKPALFLHFNEQVSENDLMQDFMSMVGKLYRANCAL